MTVRYILFFFLVLTVYIGYVEDIKQETEQLINQLKVLNTKINNDEMLINQKEKILLQIEKQKKISQLNKSKLFPPLENNSLIFGKIQQYVKNICKDLGIDVVSSSWGEVVKKEGYEKIPVLFIIRAYPQQVPAFFDKIYSYDKLLKIDNVTVGKFQKEKLVIDFVIYAYKLENKNEK